MFRLRRRKLITDTSGAAAIEFAIISLALVLFTFAILDVGFALYWFNRAEKATQLGVRVAVVSDPVTDFLTTFSGTEGGGTAGTSCSDANGVIIPDCVHPDITCTAANGTGSCTTGVFSDASFSKIFNEMRVLYPQLSSDNVEVEYRPSPLGFIGRTGAVADTYNIVPQVTVRIVNLTYTYVALGALLGLQPFTLPVISASMTGEDLDHTTAL